VVYVFWMMVYLFALPVWNFILPLYAFWHFDDFSWGETRKVEGEAKGEGHGAGGASDNGPAVPMRRWEDWERSRLRKLKREERRRREFERAHPSGYNAGERDFLAAPDNRSLYSHSQYDGSDTLSLHSSDDDHWGTQIGGYNEHNAQFPPPPVGLIHNQREALQSAKTVDGAELEAMLEMGFDDRPTPPNSTYVPRYQLTDSTTQLAQSGNGYSPLTRSSSPGVPNSVPSLHNTLSPTSPTINLPVDTISSRREPPRPGNSSAARATPTARYGPLGPLDPSAKF
jgi:chitin synthase